MHPTPLLIQHMNAGKTRLKRMKINLEEENATKGSLRGCKQCGKKGLCLEDEEVGGVISKWNAEKKS